MNPYSHLAQRRLRNAAALLVLLPIAVAAACFAHGHGALGLSGLLALLASAIGAGVLVATELLQLLPRAYAWSPQDRLGGERRPSSIHH